MVIVTGSVLVVVAKTVYCTPIVPLGWVVSVLMPVGIEMVTDVAAACTGDAGITNENDETSNASIRSILKPENFLGIIFLNFTSV